MDRVDELFGRTGDLTKLELIDLTKMLARCSEKQSLSSAKKTYQFFFKLTIFYFSLFQKILSRKGLKPSLIFFSTVAQQDTSGICPFEF